MSARSQRPSLAHAGAIGVLMLLAAPALASFIVFNQTFAAWSVICWRDEPTGAHSCLLETAPVAVGYVSRYNVVSVVEHPDGTFDVILSIRDDHKVGGVASLQIDRNAPHSARIDRFGRAAWTGVEGRAVVAEMDRGRRATLRFAALGSDAPRSVQASLERFSEALAVYRGLVRYYKAMPEAREQG